MCCVWGMAQSVNSKIWANRQRREGCWLALTLLLSGSGVSVFRAQPMAEGHTWWFVEQEEGKSKGIFCNSAHASLCLGKPGQGLLVFWGRNRFGWIKLSHLYFLSRNVTFLVYFSFFYVATIARACFSSVPVPGVPPLFSCVLYQFWIFFHCFETPSFPLKEPKPRVYSWLLSQVTRHKWPVIQASSLQASRIV